MRLNSPFKQYQNIGQGDLRRGLRYLKVDGVFSQSMGILLSSTFLVPFLIMLGANAFYVGIFTVLMSLASLSQLLSIYLMNAIRSRKKICVVNSLLARATILVMGAGILLGMRLSLSTFLLLMMVFYVFVNFSNGAFGYWMQEFVPPGIRGRYFSERTRVSLAVGSVIGLVMSMCMDVNREESYTALFLLAASLGLTGIFFLAMIPEPVYKVQDPPSSRVFRDLLRNSQLRAHFISMFFLTFSVYMSIPFFVYYMITRLGMSIVQVYLVTIAGNVFSIIFLSKWGILIDRYGIKAVLRFSAYVMFLSLLIWPFTTLPEKYPLSIPLAFIAYSLVSLALTGFNLATGLVAYYLGSDKRTSYRIALNNIFTALGSVVGSFVGSMLAIPTEFLELSLTFTVTYSERVVIYIFDLKYLDFIFVTSALVGIVATSALRKYRIEATKDEERCFMEMYMNIRRYFRGIFDHVFWIFNHRAGIRRRGHLRKCKSMGASS